MRYHKYRQEKYRSICHLKCGFICMYTPDHKFVAHFKNEITRKLCGQIKKFFACEYSKNVHIK